MSAEILREFGVKKMFKISDFFTEFSHHIEVDIRFQEAAADFAHCVTNVLFRDPTATGKLLEGMVEAISERFEHRCGIRAG